MFNSRSGIGEKVPKKDPQGSPSLLGILSFPYPSLFWIQICPTCPLAQAGLMQPVEGLTKAPL